MHHGAARLTLVHQLVRAGQLLAWDDLPRTARPAGHDLVRNRVTEPPQRPQRRSLVAWQDAALPPAKTSDRPAPLYAADVSTLHCHGNTPTDEARPTMARLYGRADVDLALARGRAVLDSLYLPSDDGSTRRMLRRVPLRVNESTDHYRARLARVWWYELERWMRSAD